MCSRGTAFQALSWLAICHASTCVLAAEHFRADYLLAAVWKGRQPFYRRAFNFQLISKPRPYPPLAKPFSLMRVLSERRGRMVPAISFFRSSLHDRERLFEHRRSEAAYSYGSAELTQRCVGRCPQPRPAMKPTATSSATSIALFYRERMPGERLATIKMFADGNTASYLGVKIILAEPRCAAMTS